MAVKDVACPGCGATSKVPEGVAGKKVKCKKCGASFRIPGGDPAGDSVGDPPSLGPLDSPLTPSPAEPAAEPNPFDFSLLDAPPEPKPPAAAKPPRPPKPADTRSTPKAAPVPEQAPAPRAARPAPRDVPAAVPAPPKAARSKSPSRASPVPAAEAVPAPDDVPTATPVDELPPAAEAFSLDEAEETPAAAANADPFSFDAAPQPAVAPTKSRPKAKALPPADEPKPAARAGYHRPAGGGSKMLLLILAAVGLFLLGGAVVGLVVFLSMKQPAEQTKAEPKEKDPKPPETPPPDPPKDEPKNPPPKDDTKPQPGKPAGKGAPAPGGPMLALPPGKPTAFQPIGEKPELAQEPQPTRVAIETEFASVRRVFPPRKPDLDTAVLWQSKPGFQGKGEKLTLDLYSTSVGSRVSGARIEMDGEDRPDPLCDLSADAAVFALAVGGKVSVWNLPDKKKLLDGFDPYADKPDDAKAGLGAVYLSEPPDVLVTVSTAGSVHAWEVSTKKPLGEFTPPRPVPNRVAAGKSVALHPGRQSVFVMSGGTLHQVTVRPAVGGDALVSLGGDVGRPLGLAVSGSGKVVFAFETDADGKKEKAVMAVRPSGRHVVHRWPDQAGEPVGAGWAGEEVAAVATTRGATVWFEAEGDRFMPLALVQAAGDKARHATAEDHWTLMPDPGDPKKSVLFEMTMPPQGLIDPLLTTQRPAFTLRLDEKGLWK